MPYNSCTYKKRHTQSDQKLLCAAVFLKIGFEKWSVKKFLPFILALGCKSASNMSFLLVFLCYGLHFCI